MIVDNIEFFNVGELEEAQCFKGKILSRLPQNVRDKMNRRARFIGRNSTGSEIRFVTEATDICVYLAALKPEDIAFQPEVKVMCGNFEHKRVQITPGEINTIHLTPPPVFERINDKVLHSKGFAPNVWRIVCGSPAIVFCGIDTFGVEYRAPKPEEKPPFHCLCYGSSITNSMIDGYPLVMGQRLGIEVSNLGLSGACQIEKEVADYIVGKQDWDAITLELGINILGIDVDDFEQRVEYIVSSLVKEHPKKPVVLITVFPCNARASYQNENGDGGEKDKLFCEVLRKVHAKYAAAGNNIHIIEGDELLDDYGCLSTDILHPRPYGHAVMGLNLAEKLRPVFGSAIEKK